MDIIEITSDTKARLGWGDVGNSDRDGDGDGDGDTDDVNTGGNINILLYTMSVSDMLIRLCICSLVTYYICTHIIINCPIS